jgi:HEPN domain-containing protein
MANDEYNKSQESIPDVLNYIINLLPKDQRQKFESGSLEKIINLLYTLIDLNKSLTEEKKESAYSFLKVGERDLKYSKEALKNKDYSKSVRDMTTAVEAFVISFGIYFLGLTDKDAQEINHHSTRAFTSVFYKDNFLPSLEIVKDIYPDKVKIPSRVEVNQTLDKLWNNEEAQKLDENQLTILLNLSKNFMSTINLEISKKDENPLGALSDLIDINQLIKIFQPVSLFVDLYIISFIAYPHYKSSQFPNNKTLKPEDYTQDLGIVKVLPQILDNLSEIDKQLIEIMQK